MAYALNARCSRIISVYVNFPGNIGTVSPLHTTPHCTADLTTTRDGTQDRANFVGSLPEDLHFDDYQKAFQSKSRWELARSIAIIKMCTNNRLVDNSLMLMNTGRKVLGNRLFDRLAKPTVYGQFVGGDSPESLLRTVVKMREMGVGPLVAVAMEEDTTDDNKEADLKYDRNLSTTLQCLEVVSGLKDPHPMMQTKLTAMFPAKLCNKALRYQSEEKAITRSKSLLPVLPNRENDHPFRGLLASQLHCNECGYRNPVRYDLFDSLSLSIPASVWGSKNLEALLQHYISAETVENVECPGCAKIKNAAAHSNITPPRSTFCKKLTIGKLPQCMCIHIQRTQWLDNGMPMKRHEHIAFPEILQMDNYVYSKVGKQQDLQSKNGLLGGKNQPLFKNVNNHTTENRSSGPVNLLRALNYDSNITRNGIFLQPPINCQVPNIHSDVNHNGPNMSKYASSEYTYKLSSVVVHLGDIMSGHFVTYRRSPMTVKGERRTDRWICCSDTAVTRAELDDVLSCQAYMLFYERM